jgi:hypothetical protein
MAKRFTDTEKYKKQFIRGLPGPYKLLWDYLYHDCDHAGIWQVDFEVAQIYLGKDMPVNQTDALKLFNKDEERIVILNNGSKWFIKPFVDFQYGELNSDNRVHHSVITALKKEGAYKGLTSPLQRAKDKDKEKDKDKDKDIIDSIRINPAYKHINIDNELLKMDAWIRLHPGRKKTPRFVLNWLNKIEAPLPTDKPKTRIIA